MRLALVTEIPAPFRIPLWNALAATDDVDLRVLLLAEHDPRRDYEVDRSDWRFESRVVGGPELRLGGRWLVASRGLGHELAAADPDLIVIGGWNQPAFLRAAGYARRHGRPYVVWVESTRRDRRPRRPGVDPVKRRLLARAAGVLVPGKAAAEYVRTLGVERERTTFAPNAIDVDGFSAALAAERAGASELRGADARCAFLSVGRLSREKGADLLVRAFEGLPADLVLVGDGPQRAKLSRLAPDNVRFVGRVDPARLPRCYAEADAFALASRSETWGMVVTEAAAAGLPIVASEAVGAAWDLVEPGVNGFRVPVENVDQLRRAVAIVASDAEFRARAAARSRQLVEGATPEAWAASVAGLARRLLA